MRTPRLGPNFALFLLFFGIAWLDALREGDWLRSLFWAAIAAVFLVADMRRPLTS